MIWLYIISCNLSTLQSDVICNWKENCVDLTVCVTEILSERHLYTYTHYLYNMYIHKHRPTHALTRS